jgi:hypothetical protein
MGIEQVFSKLFRKGGKAKATKVAKVAKAKQGAAKAAVKTAAPAVKKPASSKK